MAKKQIAFLISIEKYRAIFIMVNLRRVIKKLPISGKPGTQRTQRTQITKRKLRKLTK